MSPASAQHCSVTCSAISSIAIVTSPPGATPDAFACARIAERRRDRVADPRREIERELVDRGVSHSSRRDEYPFVELEVALGEAGHRELLGALATGRR